MCGLYGIHFFAGGAVCWCDMFSKAVGKLYLNSNNYGFMGRMESGIENRIICRGNRVKLVSRSYILTLRNFKDRSAKQSQSRRANRGPTWRTFGGRSLGGVYPCSTYASIRTPCGVALVALWSQFGTKRGGRRNVAPKKYQTRYKPRPPLQAVDLAVSPYYHFKYTCASATAMPIM
jgi:hypothetical protein